MYEYRHLSVFCLNGKIEVACNKQELKSINHYDRMDGILCKYYKNMQGIIRTTLCLFSVTKHNWETMRKADSTAIFKEGDRCELIIIGHFSAPSSRYCKTHVPQMKWLTILRRQALLDEH